MKAAFFSTIMAMAISCVLTAAVDMNIVQDSDTIPLNDISVTYSYSSYNATASSITGLSQPISVVKDELTGETIIKYSSLNVTGNYWTDGNLFYFLPMFGEGSYNFQAVNITITATGEPGQYDMFFYVFSYDCFLENFLGGGAMTLVGDALRIPPIYAEAFFQSFQPNIIQIINGMVAKNALA